jgi:hypothetical protein
VRCDVLEAEHDSAGNVCRFVYLATNQKLGIGMTKLSVEILNPKALRLLEDLADLQLIAIQPRTPLARQKPMTDVEKIQAREALMKGSPDMNLDAMLEHLRESREDRKLPFRDE